ncbi:hypothetical protein Pelo_3349 [Pelomyxa schiedti]|nr:hypothetical protein Pelo_3349 [Pelomyxa schiedti]
MSEDDDRIVRSLGTTTTSLFDVGLSTQWMDQMRSLTSLNVSVHHSVSNGQEETTVAELVRQEKLGLIVHELVLLETWRERCLPFIVSDAPPVASLIKPLLVINGELTLVNLLEVCLYSKAACESIADFVGELAEYCCRQLARTATRSPSQMKHRPDVRPVSERKCHDPTSTTT